MKKLFLSGKDIATLGKVSHAGYSFLPLVEEFVKENLPKGSPDGEINVGAVDIGDMILMIESYQADNSLDEVKKPSLNEKVILGSILRRLRLLVPEKVVG